MIISLRVAANEELIRAFVSEMLMEIVEHRFGIHHVLEQSEVLVGNEGAYTATTRTQLCNN